MVPYTTETLTPAFSQTLPSCMTRVMPPPPSARVQASWRNLVPSMSSMALQMESWASRMIFSNLALVLHAVPEHNQHALPEHDQVLSKWPTFRRPPLLPVAAVNARSQKGRRHSGSIYLGTDSLTIKGGARTVTQM